MKLSNEKLTYAILIVIILVGGTSVGLLAGNVIEHGESPTSSTQSVYSLTLIVQHHIFFNSSVGYQPAFFVLQNGTLENSSMIYVPAHTLIDLTIVSYDNGLSPLESAQYANVSGTVGGIQYVFNSTIPVNMGLNKTISTYFQVVKSENASNIAHTFTVPQLKLNIPLEPISTTFAQFYANTTGSFMWQCFAECGSGPYGTAGAMATPGWMTGTLVVY